MIAPLLLSLLLQQSPAPAPAPSADEPAREQVVPWQGTLAAGREELQRLSNAGEHDAAIAHGARLLAMPEWARIDETRRAETLFDVGVVLGAANAIDAAAESFHKSRGLAGSQPLGLDAIYDAGTFRLLAAEELRLQIPEIREKLGLPPLAQPGQAAAPQPVPPSPSTGLAAPQQEPDALAIARQGYLAARADLVDRLRCDPRDRDTRANLELVQRRLRELDELQKKREEEQQKKDEQNKDQQQGDKQNPGEQDKQKPEEEPQDESQDPSQDEQENDEQQPKPEEQEPSEEEKDEPQGQPDPKNVEEQTLSREEVMRLLDQLQKIEEQAEQVRAQLRERRRVPVKKDW